MSVQVTAGNFALASPPTGSIKVLFKNVSGVSNIRALTISNVDLDGNNIKLSLDEIQSIRAYLGQSSPLTREQLTVITRTSHPRPGDTSYYYLDVEDLFLSTANTISGSDSSIINIQPYLSQPFFNNDYNALISNAETARPSAFRYDVDRASGFVYPSNFSAIAGIGKLDFTDLYYNNANGVKIAEETTAASVPLGAYNLSSSLTSTATTADDRDVEIRVTAKDIYSAIGTKPVKLADNFTPTPGSGSYVIIESTLAIEIDSGSAFTTSGAKYQTAVIAQQTSSLVEHETIIYPFSTTISSGSYGGNIFVRLKQTNRVVSNTGMFFGTNHPDNVSYTLKSFLFATPDTGNNLPVSLYYNDQIPYAPFAPVQDSNYTHTGHSNARYNGTKTTELDYSGIGSAVSATQFQGATYLINEDDGFICSQSLSDRDVEDFLFEGTGDLPVVSTKLVGEINTANPLTNNLDDSMDITTFAGEFISAGDVFKLDNAVNTEIIQVLAVTNNTGGKFPKVTLTVERRYDGANTNLSFPAGSQVIRTAGSRVFQAKGSRLVPIGKQKLWVKDNRTIVKTNDRGFVIELSATCTV